MSRWLIVFAKSPRLGTVKTRLQTSHSAELVRKLYVAFLRDTLTMTRRVRGVDRRVIAFTPSDDEAMLRRMLGPIARRFDFIPQEGKDLGERMRHAFTESFKEGAKHTVIIGTDSPSLPARLVEEAFQALARNDLVLGPSTDGGYYLIAVSDPQSAVSGHVLDGIEWSTDRVLEQTIAHARATKLKMHLLAPWYDVDDANGLRFLRTHLNAMAACGADELPQNSWRVLQKLRAVRELPLRNETGLAHPKR